MKSKTAEVFEEHSLVGALSRFDNPIPVYDDHMGDLYIMRESMGIIGIVRAMSWYDAYSIAEDKLLAECSETIEELEKEYGLEWSEDVCFNEGYGFRPNGPNNTDKIGHGIYSKDLNGESLDVLTNEMVSEWDLTIVWDDEE